MHVRYIVLERRKEEGDIELVLMRRELWRSLQNVKAITAEFQHALVVADIDKKKIM